MGFFSSKKQPAPEPEKPRLKDAEVEEFVKNELPEANYIEPPKVEETPEIPEKPVSEKPAEPVSTPELVNTPPKNGNILGGEVMPVQEVVNGDDIPDEIEEEVVNDLPPVKEGITTEIKEQQMSETVTPPTDTPELTEEQVIQILQDMMVRIQNLESELFRIKSAFR